MRRIQFVEIHDQPWFPAFLRDMVTDDLQVLLNLGNPYRAIVQRLGRALERARTHGVVDLCSGAGGPWPWLLRAFDEEGLAIQVCLTDKYPNSEARASARAASAGGADYYSSPVDATRVPAGLRGFRTMFSSFHHFPPEQARAILQDAISSGQGIGIFELPGRHLLTLLLVLLVPIGAIAVPFLRPRRWPGLLARLVWTLLLPVVPAVLLFDGIVSCLRAYSLGELRQLAEGPAENKYAWEIGEEKRGALRLPITYLIGYPITPDAPR
jgi:hypothetical protein